MKQTTKATIKQEGAVFFIHNPVGKIIDIGFASYNEAKEWAEDTGYEVIGGIVTPVNEGQQQPVQGEGFTPGEWEVDNTSVNGISIWANSERDNGILLASVWTEARGEEAEANARLIASAPTLYRENQQLKKELQSWKDENFDNVDEANITIQQQAKDIELLREALQKSMEIIDRLGEEYSTVANKHSSYTRGEYNSLNKALKQTEPKQ